MLVQGDVLLKDLEPLRFLQTKGPFDAVTLWLTGAYQGRRSCMNLDEIGMKDTADYRLCVQSNTYDLARKLLRPGGILQIVDRGEVPQDQTLEQEVIEFHRDVAGPRGLEVQSIRFRPYKEITGGIGMRVKMEPVPGQDVSNLLEGMSSLTCRKV
jgi:hypothetical protein